MILSILLSPYFDKSIGSFFFYYLSPNNEPNCFLNIYIVFNELDDGKFIDFILSSPFRMNTAFVWSNWLFIFTFFSWNTFSCTYALNCAPTCIFFVELKKRLILWWWAMYLRDLESHFLLSVSYFSKISYLHPTMMVLRGIGLIVSLSSFSANYLLTVSINSMYFWIEECIHHVWWKVFPARVCRFPFSEFQSTLKFSQLWIQAYWGRHKWQRRYQRSFPSRWVKQLFILEFWLRFRNNGSIIFWLPFF